MSDAPESTANETLPCLGPRVSVSLVAKLNLADYQNAVPALRELAVSNDGDRSYEHLLLSASSDPCFFKPRQWHIDAIGPGQTCDISALDLQLDGPLLTRLSESESARVRLELAHASDPCSVIFEWEQDLELLPRNHWGGLSHIPEMVAAFVQPNDPAVDRLLKKSAQILRESGRDAALNGYGSGPKHAWEILSAIWVALAAEKLDYSLPPASFEETGQKVRSPSQILDSGIATCLDLALFLAAAAEQAGLNPLLIFTAGHAFAGCWLRAEEFATTVVDDPSALRKRLQLRELLAFETTVVTGQSVPSFSRACEIGAKLLDEDASARFEVAVDIRRARMHKIRPLAAAEPISPEAPAARITEEAPIAIEDAPDLPDDQREASVEPDPRSLAPADRVARWQRKLLDLSLRNSLLNFRKNKRAVTIDAPDPGLLEDTLACDQALRISPRPDLMDGSDPRSRTLHEGRTQEDTRRQHSLEGLAKGEIFATAGDHELDSTLVELFRSARASLEEGGANTLFLALGFLIWTQEGKDQQKHRAPLILIPVTLNRRSVRSGFTLSLHEDEPLFNPTLVEMLHQDFELHLGIPEGDLPKDDHGLDVKGIWDRVSEAVKDIKGWEIVPDVVLSTFSFAKHLMWKDLVHRTEQLRQNPVVRHLIDTPREPYRSEVRFVDPKALDSECHPRETFCPLAADSSQLAAIMSAARGKDFVLIGPPGTGKSQTISNLIAHCIASGRRVLFVAEKIAALEVVYRRLQREGLGQFCLELHSSKAKKTAVLEALGAAWNNRGVADAQAWEAEASRLKALRDHLNSFVQQLHKERPNGLTVHRALGHAVAGHDVPQVDFGWDDPTTDDVARLEELRGIVAKLETHSIAFGIEDLASTPLLPVGQPEWNPLWQAEFLRSVRHMQTAAAQVSAAYKNLAEMAGLPTHLPLMAAERTSVAELARVLPECVGTRWMFTARADAAHVIEELRVAISLVSEHRSVASRIGEPWTANVTAACRRGLALLRDCETLRAAVPAPWPATIVAELERGIGLLEYITEQEHRLSARYNVSAVHASALEAEWHDAQQSFWPMSALKKRRIRAALTSAVTTGDHPDPEADLPILSNLERTRSDVAGIDLRALPTGIWSGLQTSAEVARDALRLQSGLATVRDGTPWTPTSLDLVASGLCGPDLKQAFDSLLRLAGIDKALSELNWLSDATGGLWAAAGRNPDALMAAADFCDQWRAGELRGVHDAVARGDCGDYLREQHDLLQQRTRLERRVGDFADLALKTDGLWGKLDTDIDEVGRAIEFSGVLEGTIPVFAHTDHDILVARSGIEQLCRSGLAPDTVREAAAAFSAAVPELALRLDTMARSGSFSQEYKTQFESAGANELRRSAEAIQSAAPRLQRWCSWVQAREEARAHGLGGLVTSIEESRIAPHEVGHAFEVNYSRYWLNHVVSADEILRTFVSTEHEKRIADFRTLDDRYTALTRDWIRAKLCASVPDAESVPVSAEWGILRGELTKKRRQLPLRELMARIPSVVTTLAPCLLMSPLSIAQYLSVSTAAFDVVVFDEASQIAVWDAIGAIARAKQVVMVGDPKQLPPTNFFNRAEGETDVSDDVPEDMESILDECIGASLPSIQLLWHYRSRHESLIAFSNRRYYGGKLVTFPSPVTDDRAVSFHYVRGVYDKSGARTNLEEARAVVGDIVSRLKSQAFVKTGYSIGVVTFNAEQQSLVEDLLDAERRKDPSIEAHFSQDRLEPVFVKNLESVQGDERDIMYFSVSYGPDIAGKLSMNFGPMNRDGGERRLNVAITRARRELRVFSSLRPEQVDLSRTQAVGVSELKHFLEFAERGPRAFAEAVTGSVGGFESPFEEYVASALESRGWTIHSQVGASGFRIDLGVVHPDAHGIYLAGIECDGAMYHRAATARDRDKLREQVLRDLGWEILRVWSTDWWIDRTTTLNRVDAQLRAILEQSRKNGASGTVPSAPVIPEPDQEVLPQEAVIGVPASASGGEYKSNQGQLPSAFPAPDGTDPSQFFERSYDAELTRMVVAIVESEGPILDEVLTRRIARQHGWQRTGTRITERVTRIAARRCKKTKEDVGTFFWPSNLEPGEHYPFRSGLDRSVEEICMPELVSLAMELVASGRTGEDAISSMAKAVGLQRLRAASRPRLHSALRRAQRKLNDDHRGHPAFPN